MSGMAGQCLLWKGRRFWICEVIYHPREQQVAALFRFLSVAQSIQVEYLKPLSDRADRKLLPAQVDKLKALTFAPDVPEMAFGPGSSPDLPASNLKIGIEVLHDAGGRVALTESRVMRMKITVIGGQMIPRRF